MSKVRPPNLGYNRWTHPVILPNGSIGHIPRDFAEAQEIKPYGTFTYDNFEDLAGDWVAEGVSLINAPNGLKKLMGSFIGSPFGGDSTERDAVPPVNNPTGLYKEQSQPPLAVPQPSLRRRMRGQVKRDAQSSS